MKKVLLCFLVLVFFASVSFADSSTDIRLETLFNRVYDSTNQAIKVRISGDAQLSSLTADNILVYNKLTTDYLTINNIATVDTVLFTSRLGIPNGNDLDVTNIGDFSWDSNGQWLRTYDHTYGQVAVGTRDKNFTMPLEDPENTPTHAVRNTRSKLVWQNNSGMTFRLTRIYGVSDTTGYYFRLYKSNASNDIDVYNQVTMDVVSCDNSMTGGFYHNITSGFDNSTIENGKWLIWEHGGSSAEEVSVAITGVFSADVN